MEFIIDNLSIFEWRQPIWLWALVFPFAWSSYQAWWLRKQQVDYAEARFWPWVMASKNSHEGRLNLGLSSLHIGWLGVAWISLILAIAGPRLAHQLPQTDQRAGVDVLVLLDASRSMSAEDVSPTRFAQAQALVESLNRRLAVGDRLGLIAYAGQAHWVTPLTEDRALFNRALHLISAEFLPLAGSQLFDALDFAQQQLMAVKRAPALILLLSDGGGLAPTNPLMQTLVEQKITGQNLKLHVIGVGTTQAALLRDTVHPSGWLHDDNQPVTVPLARSDLHALAQQAGGRYFDATDDLALIETLLEEIKNQAVPLESSETYTEYQEFASWFMLFALGILLWRFVFPRWSMRSKLTSTTESSSSSTTHLLLLTVIFSGGLTVSFTDQAWSQSSEFNTIELQAYHAFERADYAEAERLYREVDAFNGQLGAGNAAYRQTHYERAIVWYRQALLLARDDSQRAQAIFNIANSYMQIGLYAFAVEAFADAQTYKSPFEKAQHNHVLAQYALAQQLAELQAQAEREAAEAEQKGKGARRYLEGSFHGGQKPDPNNSAGSGAEGDSDDGRSEGEAFSLPTQRDDTNLKAQSTTDWQINADQRNIEQVRKNWVQQRRLEQLEQQLQNLADDQQGLLKHLFEREAGFQAKQDEVREIPGVTPW